MDIFLTAAQVVEIAQRGGNSPDFQARTVQYWTSEGLLLPVNPKATRHRRYVPREAVIARACARWYALGVRSQALKPLAGELRKILNKPDVSSQQESSRSRGPEASDRYSQARMELDAAQRDNGFALLVYGGPETSTPMWEVVTRHTKNPLHYNWSNALVLNWHQLMRHI
jgi:DNA-binding transcriptional MerR regulator